LSRYPPLHPICAISSCTPAWIENLVAGYKDDAMALKLLTELALHSPNKNGFSLEEGVIRHRQGVARTESISPTACVTGTTQ